MENKIENKKIRTIDQAKEIVLDIFQKIDWAQLGLISQRIQIRSGMETPISPFFASIQFVNLPHGRTFSVPNSTTFRFNETELAEVYNKNEPYTLSCDLNALNNNGWELATDEEFNDYIKESLLHEYTHLISYTKPEQIHSEINNIDLPHSIMRSGVEENHITGNFRSKDISFESFGGRLKEVLTEYARTLIQEEYEPKNNDKHKKAASTYTEFVVVFNVLVLAIHKETGVAINTITNSFLKAYFNGEDILSNHFLQNLPEDCQYTYLELLKEETNTKVFWEYIQLLTEKYEISKEELMSLSLKRN